MKMKVLAMLFAMVMLAGTAYADTLDFTLSPGGSISYAGGANPLVGSSIPVTSVTLLSGGPAYAVLGGLLNFSTGNFTGNTATQWYFGTGGFITVTGCVDANGNTVCDAGEAQGVLLAGSFVNGPAAGNAATVVQLGSTFYISGGTFADEKNLDLLQLFNFPLLSSYVGAFNYSFLDSNNPAPPNGFSGLGGSGDVLNTVPEPASLALFGSGLVAFGGLLRRRLI